MPDTLTPDSLPDALADEAGLRILSLDCFDTLLWRDTHAPADVFATLDGIPPAQRQRAEATARKMRLLAGGGSRSGEVTLREIYAAHAPHADAATREALVAAEIAAEMRHCYGFAPTIALMRDAKRRGLKIIVVSDTYLERDQLEALIRAAAGDEAVDMIDRIFCSCEHRSAKAEALFATVLRIMQVQPNKILHIGDNPNADLVAARRHGLRARHLVQFSEATVQRLRQEAAAGALMLPSGAAFQPHRAALALAEPTIDDPAEAIGYGVLGPILATFADWIDAEANELATASGGAVHRLYLMRDGHLPAAVAEASGHAAPAHRVEISRFTAIAASLCTEKGVRDYVLEEIGDDVGREFLRQMLLTPSEIEQLLKRMPAKRGAFWMAETITSPKWIATIRARGRDFADRLLAYLAAQFDPAPGDTLMLIDLGYNGSVQNRIDAVLADRLGTHVAGRYLLLREDTSTGLDKRGLIDARTLEDGALQVMLGSVAVVEQFCTVADGSVVDYRDGKPIRNAPGVKGAQSVVRDRIQAGALRFARDHAAAVVRPTDPMRVASWTRGATAALARLLTLPLPHELDLLRAFEHDVNLGTAQTVPLFDPQEAASGMRRGGLFYLKGVTRMFLPAELRGQGLLASLSHIVGRRFLLDLRYADFCDTDVTLPLLVADGARVFTDTVRATPTHDGYYVAAVPVGAGRFTIGLQFGKLFEWVQIDAAEFLPVRDFMAGGVRRADTRRVPATPSCEGIEQIAPHLFRCDSAGFLMVPPIASDDAVPMMLSVIFRPLVVRDPVAQAAPIFSPVLAGAMQ